MIYQPEQAINIAKGCVMASAMDNETKMVVLEMLNLVAISKTETTSCEWCDKTLMLFTKSGKYIPENQPPRNYCPNCGRKIKED